MLKRIAAINDHLHNLHYRVEELRGDIEKQIDYNTVEYLEPIRTAVNNLAAVLVVAEDSLEEVKQRFGDLLNIPDSKSVKEKIN